MSLESTARDLEFALAEVPVIDIHTHLVGGRLAARGLHDILLYHMVVSDLYAAGCPSGARLSQYPQWPSPNEAHARLNEAIPFLPNIRNTGSYWGVKIILAHVYDWHEEITRHNWRKLDELIRDRSDDHAQAHALLNRMNVRRTGTEIARREAGQDDDRLQYALEWGFFTRCQWGEFDTALYELERCWGRTPESPSPIGAGARPATDRRIQTLSDVHDAIRHYVSAIPEDQILATATHISTDIGFRDISDAEMEAALLRRNSAGVSERDIYASYIQEEFLNELESKKPGVVYQFSLGAEPLPFETASRLSQRTIADLATMIGRHSGLRFQCFLASRHANQSLCTLARELPNLSLAGYWWHNFSPSAIEHVISERLDMLPANKQVGFFSDAYCVEWTYAKLTIVRKIFSRCLASRIESGQYTSTDALAIARTILFEAPISLLGFSPQPV